MHRRDLLKRLALLPLVAQGGALYAAPAAGSSRLLVVFLRGAYDAANLLVPISSSFYYQSRPTLAIARPAAGAAAEPGAALPLTADWGLHPALAKSLYPLYQRGELALVPFAGTDDVSRSHFETQDTVEMGQALTARRDYQSGFLGRLAGVLNADRSRPAPVAFTSQPPLVFRGDAQVPNVALGAQAKGGVDARQAAAITAMYEQTAWKAQVAEGFAVRDAVQEAAAKEMDAASRNAVSAKGFERDARRMARLMASRFQIGFVDVGGWDTHVGQGGATGYLANRFDELGRGLAGFAEEMGPAWKDTVVVVISEFGRTFRENGNRGTDHGHGTVYWVMGGNVRGGRIAGEQVAVSQATLFQDRDYPVLNDYRSVFGGVFQRLYGLRPDQLETVFKGVAPGRLDLV